MSDQQSLAARGSKWWNSCDTGVSSKSIFLWMSLGIWTGQAPFDPADLGRCLRLLRLFPEWADRMPEMAEVDRSWASILPHWKAISDSMADEVGIDWGKGRSAPLTYKLMTEVRP